MAKGQGHPFAQSGRFVGEDRLASVKAEERIQAVC